MKKQIHGLQVILVAFLFTFGITKIAVAQVTLNTPSWYIGVKGNTSLGVSNFSSFGAEKTRLGYGGGFYGGYQFSSLFSVEASAAWSKLAMSARDCCIEKGYWLGVDGLRYYAPVSGMSGADYAALRSNVKVQQYGLHANINLLALFSSVSHSAWQVNVSPAISAIGTKAQVNAPADNLKLLKSNLQWHVGLGGDLSVAYHINKHLSSALYSGITFLTGNSFDGIPQYPHKNNFIWQSGVRMQWTFGKKKASVRHTAQIDEVQSTSFAPTVDAANLVENSIVEEPDTIIAQESVPNLNDDILVPIEDVSFMPSNELFPVIYFSFNSVWIEPAERSKIKTLAETLKNNPGMQIIVTGYTDSVGGEKVNLRVSKQRADAVKRALRRYHIVDNRITTVAGGINKNAPTDVEARTAVTIELKKEEQQ